MENQNSRSPKSWTPRLTNAAELANCCTWSDGKDMKELMKKLLGYWPPNSDTHQTCLWTFTLLILINQVQTINYSLFYFSLSELKRTFYFYLQRKHLWCSLPLPSSAYTSVYSFCFFFFFPSISIPAISSSIVGIPSSSEYSTSNISSPSSSLSSM